MKHIKYQLMILFILLRMTGFGQTGEVNPGQGAVTIADRIIHDENIILADHGFIRSAVAEQKATIYFGQNSTAIDLNLPMNLIPAVYDGVTGLKNFVSKGWEIKNIQIEGWSSPEGDEKLNNKVALKRAESGKIFVKELLSKLKSENISINNIPFDPVSRGEDMDGFLYFIQVSAIPDKAAIIESLNLMTDNEAIEKEIENLRNSYPEIDQTIFPMLRRIEIGIYCIEPQYDDQKMLEMALSDPKALNFNELLYAATLTDELSQKILIYEWAANLTNDRWEAFNNVGCIFLMMEKNEKAISYLSRANNAFPIHGTILNNLGVASIRITNLEKAEGYLKQAEIEETDVNYNMGILRLLQDEYRDAVKYLEKRKCNYNLALALTYSGNLTKAMEILSCSPEKAKKYYLMAVIGAKQNRISVFYDNLQKALEIEPSLKILVQSDEEFIKYRDQLDFKEMFK